MFINRKTRRLSRNKIVNQNQEFTDNIHSQLQIVSYPILEYLFGCVLIGLSAFLLYSASGGANGIYGFKERFWWQFLIAVLPMVFGIGFIIACQIQSLFISRKNNLILATKTRFFCFVTQQIQKQFNDLFGISVVKAGKQMANISMTNYHIILSFKTCDELPVLRCISEGKMLDYFQQLRRFFSQQQISQKRVVVHNLIQ